jgi:hypothetical protein
VSDRHTAGPGEQGRTVPRDMPDQQATTGPDPLDPGPLETESAGSEEPDVGDPDHRIPDADEAGAGRRGSPNSGAVHPEKPVPDESPG